jgi:predicted transcriptional regulator YdeE
MRSRFPPLSKLGLLAQLVEQVTLNHRVGGSSPSQPTPRFVGELIVSTKNISARLICGVPVEIYSIMFVDQYDPMAIPTAWQKFWNEFPKSDFPKNSEAFGVSTPIAGSNGKLRYIAGVEVNPGYVAPAGFELVTIPAGNYLEVTHSGNISNLAQSYGKAYGVVFPQSGLEMREGPHLELYNSTLDPNSDDFNMGILIPVK